MKNTWKMLLAATIMALIALKGQSQTSTAPTTPPLQKQTFVNTATGTFIDSNNNGICDNFEARSGNRRGANYVDKSRDGICKNQANGIKNNGNNCRNGKGNAYRYGKGNGNGRCCRR